MLTQEEIKNIMHCRNYELHYRDGANTMFSFTKSLDDDMNVAAIFDSTFTIHCEVTVDDTFKFVYITKRWAFQLTSSEMGLLNRSDFSNIEADFIRYARRLYKAD